ncbi:putative polyketide synthase [Athelia psychrophila]|uniref:Polyketide synthase n=1 Tax=Athelia psychrophila TaxID=1759441 RepID=A0A166T3T9_9AGAM|nr:putative polyketide synthase [Fibularhizoctonia sp. CBS 109695]
MSSRHPDVPVFSGQGTDFANAARAHAQGVRDASTPAGSVLLAACFDAFREELSALSAEQRVKSEIRLDEQPHVYTGIDLLAPSPQAVNNPILSGARLFLLQVLRYLAHVENSSSSQSRFRDALLSPDTETKSLGILGFSSGVLAACVTASSLSLPAYMSYSIQAFRLAFWIGFRLQEYRRNVLVNMDSTASQLPWSVAVFGLDHRALEGLIADFGTRNNFRPTITAVTAPELLTVSGHPVELQSFCASLPSSCTIHSTTLSTLYHSATHLASARQQILEDASLRNVRFPELSDLAAPIRSTYTGELIGNTTPGSLIELVVDMLLMHPVNWDLAVASLKLDAGISAFRLANYGPGVGLMRITEKALEGAACVAVDMTLECEGKSNQRNAKHEPIAIVGMAVNMPGAPDKAKLWEVLEEGFNMCTEIPESRFKVSDYAASSIAQSGRSMRACTGNFISSASAFDAKFFKISPREARSMDPQQRILLQVAYAALENAGYIPDSTPSFQRDSIGCFVGAATKDYAQNLRSDIDVYYSTGTLAAFLSGRISYVMQLGGLSVTVDTACSSSTVAIYQACRAISTGDCSAAIAGGVNVITSPDMMLGLDRGHFLSPTGQCKAFDASADGYSRGEGCGMFVLKKLSDAVAENDHILGVIRSIEVNQSGMASSITHPHPPSQIKLFRKVMENAGIDPSRVSVVEAHGTGTQAGDPCEMESIRAVFSANRSMQHPLHVTSIKANVGHLGAASGAAGLAKLLLMFQRQTIPRQILFNELNPEIAPLGLDHTVISTSHIRWPSTRGSNRFALLNNFGAAGSNAALLLEEYQDGSPATIKFHEHVMLGISAKTEKALMNMRSDYITWLQKPDNSRIALSDIAYTATARRQIHPHRLALSVCDKQELVEKLTTATPIHVSSTSDGVVFVFSGQGSQYLGMGASLYRTCPLFRRHIDECNTILLDANFSSILPIIMADEDAEDVGLSREAILEACQTSIFAIEYSLAKLWMSWGISPVAVVGHSIGEYAALVIAGVLSLQDALRLVARRIQLMLKKCPPQASGMLAVKLPSASVARLDILEGLSIACYNGGEQCVVSGAIDKLKMLMARLNGEGYKGVILDVPFGYHSSAMHPLLGDLKKAAERVCFSAPRIPVASNVHGKVVFAGDASVFNAEYIVRHCREPVLFEQAITALLNASTAVNAAAWIELGPDATVLPMLRSHPKFPLSLLLASLRKGTDTWKVISRSLEKLYLSNVHVLWREVYAHKSSVKCVDLPSYPFDTTEYWIEFQEELLPPSVQPSLPASSIPKYTMLCSWSQYPSQSNERTAIFLTPITKLAEFINAHSVGGFPLCPASIYLEQIYAGVALVIENLAMGDGCITLRDVEFVKPLVYVENVACMVKTRVSLPFGVPGSFKISSSYLAGDENDVIHAQGFIILKPPADLDRKFARHLPALCRHIAAVTQPLEGAQPQTFSMRTVYKLIFPRVVNYGEIYQAIKSLTIDPTGMEGSATIQFPPRDKRPNELYCLHPVFFDAMFHVAGFVANLKGEPNDAYICTGMGSVHIAHDIIDEAASYSIYCCNSWIAEEEIMLAYVYALQLNGPRKIVAHIKGLQFRRVRLDGFKRILSVAAGQKPPSLRDASSSSYTTLVEPYPLSPLSLSPNRDVSHLVKQVTQVIAETCLIDAATIHPNVDLSSLGIDSLLSIEVLQKLQKLHPGTRLGSKMLGCSTVSKVVECILNEGEPGQDVNSFASPSTLLPSPVVPDFPSPSNYVKEIFGSVLGLRIDDINEDADLESLGLDSLTTIEAIHCFKQSGHDLSHDIFQTYNTIRAIQIFLSESPQFIGKSNCGPRLNRIQVFSRGAPLFLIHDGSGMVDYFSRMPSLGRDVWTIPNPHFGNDAPWPWADLESMAQEYTSYVTSMSSGPVLVGGWSFGGVVAFEIARQLLKGGTDARVLLIDSPSPINHVPLDECLIESITNANMRSTVSSMSRIIRAQFRFNSKSLGMYKPLLSDGPFPKIILLRSKEGFPPGGMNNVPSWLSERGDPHDAVAGWEALVGCPVRVRDIPGHHFEPFSPSNIDEVSYAMSQGCSYLEEGMLQKEAPDSRIA